METVPNKVMSTTEALGKFQNLLCVFAYLLVLLLVLQILIILSYFALPELREKLARYIPTKIKFIIDNRERYTETKTEVKSKNPLERAEYLLETLSDIESADATAVLELRDRWKGCSTVSERLAVAADIELKYQELVELGNIK